MTSWPRCPPAFAPSSTPCRCDRACASSSSARGVSLTERACAAEVAAGLLSTRCVAAEDLVLEPGERRYDLVVANRVGALDGRHPDAGERVLERLGDVLTAEGSLWVDGVRQTRS